MVNENYRSIGPGDAPSNRRGWRRGDWVRRRQPRPGQEPTGEVVHVNRAGLRRLQVHWADGTVSNVSVRSVIKI